MISRLYAALSGYEKAIAAFAISPWSSGVLLLFGAVYVCWELWRGKSIGFDGFLTVAFGEVGLATLRRAGR